MHNQEIQSTLAPPVESESVGGDAEGGDSVEGEGGERTETESD